MTERIFTEFKPNVVYIKQQFPYDKVKQDVQNKFDGKCTNLDSVFFVELNKTTSISVTNRGYLTIYALKNSISEDNIIDLATQIESIIQVYMNEFKYFFPEALLRRKLYQTMDKHGKLNGELNEPSSEDKKFVNELLKRIVFEEARLNNA